MTVLAKFDGIVIRLLLDRTFGVRLHAFYGYSELVIGLNPVRLLTSEVPAWVEAWVLGWVREHQWEFSPPRAWRSGLVATALSKTGASMVNC